MYMYMYMRIHFLGITCSSCFIDCVCVCVCADRCHHYIFSAFNPYVPITRYRWLSGSNTAAALQASAPLVQRLQCSMMKQPLNDMKQGKFSQMHVSRVLWCTVICHVVVAFLVLGLWGASWWLVDKIFNPPLHGTVAISPWRSGGKGVCLCLHSGEWG